MWWTSLACSCTPFTSFSSSSVSSFQPHSHSTRFFMSSPLSCPAWRCHLDRGRLGNLWNRSTAFLLNIDDQTPGVAQADQKKAQQGTAYIEEGKRIAAKQAHRAGEQIDIGQVGQKQQPEALGESLAPPGFCDLDHRPPDPRASPYGDRDSEHNDLAAKLQIENRHEKEERQSEVHGENGQRALCKRRPAVPRIREHAEMQLGGHEQQADESGRAPGARGEEHVPVAHAAADYLRSMLRIYLTGT